ncbi:glucuronate isomerase [Candidatus Binatus sp.]|uniref:glucuronate isomerase n=1 Tax=Candidatus Binatus sp. TaxID=2811406 RepID=UPI003BB08A2D
MSTVNDHKKGNLDQLSTLSNHGVLGTFIGMTTDSRSLASEDPMLARAKDIGK